MARVSNPRREKSSEQNVRRQQWWRHVDDVWCIFTARGWVQVTLLFTKILRLNRKLRAVFTLVCVPPSLGFCLLLPAVIPVSWCGIHEDERSTFLPAETTSWCWTSSLKLWTTRPSSKRKLTKWRVYSVGFSVTATSGSRRALTNGLDEKTQNLDQTWAFHGPPAISGPLIMAVAWGQP